MSVGKNAHHICDVCGQPVTGAFTDMYGLGVVCDWCRAEGEIIFAKLPECIQKNSAEISPIKKVAFEFIGAGCESTIVKYCTDRFTDGYKCFTTRLAAPEATA